MNQLLVSEESPGELGVILWRPEVSCTVSALKLPSALRRALGRTGSEADLVLDEEN